LQKDLEWRMAMHEWLVESQNVIKEYLELGNSTVSQNFEEVLKLLEIRKGFRFKVEQTSDGQAIERILADPQDDDSDVFKLYRKYRFMGDYLNEYEQAIGEFLKNRNR